MLKTIFTIFLCLLCTAVEAKERSQRKSKDNPDDKARVALTVGTTSFEHQGDFKFNSGTSTLLGVELEYLKTDFSSSYLLTYSPGSTASLYQVEKGFFYYFNGAKRTLRNRFDLRLGGAVGLGKFHLENLKVGRVIYHEMESFFVSASVQADAFYRISARNHVGVGLKYNYLTGTQDVFWNARALEYKLTVFHSF